MRRKLILAVAVPALVETAVLSYRRGRPFGTDSIVRCRSGHLFTTIWIPGASFKAVRLGWWRYQRCPVGKHWTLVTPVKEPELTDEERQLATVSRDVRIP